MVDAFDLITSLYVDWDKQNPEKCTLSPGTHIVDNLGGAFVYIQTEYGYASCNICDAHVHCDGLNKPFHCSPECILKTG